MALVFAGGMAGITLEELWGFSKAGVALLTAASLWVIRATTPGVEAAAAEAETSAALAQTSDLIFFLLAAMTVVEVVDAHGGFDGLAAALRPPAARRRGGGGEGKEEAEGAPSSSSPSSLLATRVGLATAVTASTFFMSALLDNLTTTIVVLSVVNRALADGEEEGNSNDGSSNDAGSLASLRLLLGGLVVVAANAGGAWTPIGDVTTTLLWVQGHLSPGPTVRDLFLPSLVCAAVPLALLAATAPELRGPVVREQEEEEDAAAATPPPTTTAAIPPRSRRGGLVLGVGVGALLFTPVFRELTHLPASFGALSGLAALWLVTDAIHFGEGRASPRVKEVLPKVDVEGVLFFAGVLLSVGALDAAGVLAALAAWLGDALPGGPLGLAAAIGVASAVVDNVPLVAAASSMFGGGGGAEAAAAAVAMDAPLWQLIALAAGTGGSLLIIGSASGIALMSLVPRATFGWFLKRLTPAALAGFAAGLGVYALQQQVVNVGGTG
jgi:Na+/H+ antiporter NhaD/arsenite permease-like protein